MTVADRVTGVDLGALLRTVTRGAFRLEPRDRYNVPSEAESLARFLAGDPDDSSVGQSPWYEMTAEAARAGRPFLRVRVVSTPPSDYVRYGLWAAAANLAAGEEIRYLDRDHAATLGLPVTPPHDAWLLDDTKVVVLHFDADDRFIEAELRTDPATIEQHRRWQAIAWNASVSRDEFLQAL